MTGKNKTLFVFDHVSDGHHDTYMYAYVRALLELGHNVWTFYPKDNIFSDLQTKYSSSIRTYSFYFRQRSCTNKYLIYIYTLFCSIALWIHTVRAIKEVSFENRVRPDLVILLWLDSYLNPLLRPWMFCNMLSFKWCGLLFHPTYLKLGHRGLRKLLARTSYILNSRSCTCALILDESISDKLHNEINNNVVVVPDITNDDNEIDHDMESYIVKNAKGRVTIGLIGGLEARKGLITLIQAIRLSDVNKYFFIIAGSLQRHTFNDQDRFIIDSFISNIPENCIFLNTFIKDGRIFNTIVRYCTIIYATYTNFPHSSNILTKAALFKKPVIVSDKYLMGQRVKDYKLGVCIREHDTAMLLKSIYLLSEGKDLDGMFLTPHYEQYYDNHTYSRLKHVLSEIIQ